MEANDDMDINLHDATCPLILLESDGYFWGKDGDSQMKHGRTEQWLTEFLFLWSFIYWSGFMEFVLAYKQVCQNIQNVPHASKPFFEVTMYAIFLLFF